LFQDMNDESQDPKPVTPGDWSTIDPNIQVSLQDVLRIVENVSIPYWEGQFDYLPDVLSKMLGQMRHQIKELGNRK